MGIDVSEEAGWLRNKGLRIIGGGMRLELDWPELAGFPDYGLVRKRDDFDEHARPPGAEGRRAAVRGCNVSGPDPRRAHRPDHRRHRQDWRRRRRRSPSSAPLVVAADGNSTRLSLAMGLHRREDRPMGVAVRTYFT